MLGAEFLEMKEVGSSTGVTVLHRSKFSVYYTKTFKHTNCIILKIKLLPLDENDCFAYFKCCLFLRK